MIYSYAYDTCAYGVGRLCSATSLYQVSHAFDILQWTYTPQGREASRTDYLNGGSESLTYAYNDAGQVSSLTYPSGAIVGYTYNGNNQIASMNVAVNGATTALLNNVQYEPFGRVRSWTWAMGRRPFGRTTPMGTSPQSAPRG